MEERKFRVLDKGYIRVDRVDGCEQDIVNAARVSHASAGTAESDLSLLKFLQDKKHNTPFRFVGYVLSVKMPIFVARQWMRHTTGCSYVEQSARYTEMTDYYLPVEGDLDILSTMDEVMCNAFSAYDKMLEFNVPKEQARMVLPMSTYTKVTWVVNLQSLMHFLKLRLDKHAQKEIREYAKVVYAIAYTDFPNVIGNMDTEL